MSLRGARATPKLHAACVVREPYCSAPLLGEFVCARVRVTSCARDVVCVWSVLRVCASGHRGTGGLAMGLARRNLRVA